MIAITSLGPRYGFAVVTRGSGQLSWAAVKLNGDVEELAKFVIADCAKANLLYRQKLNEPPVKWKLTPSFVGKMMLCDLRSTGGNCSIWHSRSKQRERERAKKLIRSTVHR